MVTKRMPDAETAAELLRGLLDELNAKGKTDAECADEIGVPRSAFVDWMGAKTKDSDRPRSRPNALNRERIERWSKGRVPARAWDTKDERKKIETAAHPKAS